MNPRRLLFTCSLAALSLAQTPALSPRPAQAAPAADTPAVAVVRAFIAGRFARDRHAAYVLLSAETRRQLPYAEFAAGHWLSVDPYAEGMTPPLTAVSLLFTDTHNGAGYQFSVLGAVPGAANVVRVTAKMTGPGTRPSDDYSLVCDIATVAGDEENALRLDLMASYRQTAPGDFAAMREAAVKEPSRANLRKLAVAIWAFAQDHDEHYPDAARWMDEIHPYLKSETVFHDPAAPAGEKWSYAFNRRLSGVSAEALVSPPDTVLVFESASGSKNASDTGQSVPRPGWHKGGTDYALADGHIKWFRDGTKPSYRSSGK